MTTFGLCCCAAAGGRRQHQGGKPCQCTKGERKERSRARCDKSVHYDHASLHTGRARFGRRSVVCEHISYLGKTVIELNPLDRGNTVKPYLASPRSGGLTRGQSGGVEVVRETVTSKLGLLAFWGTTAIDPARTRHVAVNSAAISARGQIIRRQIARAPLRGKWMEMATTPKGEPDRRVSHRAVPR